MLQARHRHSSIACVLELWLGPGKQALIQAEGGTLFGWGMVIVGMAVTNKFTARFWDTAEGLPQ